MHWKTHFTLIVFFVSRLWADPTELNLERGISVTWPTESDRSYQLQSSDGGVNNWSDVGALITGDGAEQSYFDFNNVSARDYRLVVTDLLAANLSAFKNGGFELGSGISSENWSTSNGALAGRSSEAAYQGLYSIRVNIENEGDDPSSVGLTQTTLDGAVTAGETYDLAFWMKDIRNGVSYLKQYEFQWLNQNGEVIGGTGSLNINEVSSNWYKVSNEGLVAPASAVKAQINFRFATGAVMGGLGETFIDEVSLSDPSVAGNNISASEIMAVDSEESGKLSWSTIFGNSYQLFTSTNLEDWTEVGAEVIGSGATYSTVIHYEDMKSFYRVEFLDGGVLVNTNIISLFNSSTPLEPEITVKTDSALITYMADRARDRHAREDMFQAYDHYLSWYWEERTLALEIIDKVAKGGDEIVFNYTTQGELDAPEFRAFYLGINTVAEYYLNLSATRVAPLQYTATISSNAAERRPLQLGDRIELEISQFLDSPTNGRSNYYGTTFLYIVGKGVVPWEAKGELEDSFPLPEAAWLGGLTTLPYQYSNEPEHRFKQTAGNIAPISIQPFMQGRRLHHTDYLDGSHSEPGNPIFAEHVGKLGPNYIAQSCVACHVNNGRSLSPSIGEPFLQGVVKVGSDATGSRHPLLGSVLQPRSTSPNSEGNLTIESYTFTNGSYGDGTPYTLRKPNFSFDSTIPSHFSVRYSQQLVGLGLLEAVDENIILSFADPEDSDGDGISGRPQTVLDPETQEIRLGRFTSKAAQSTIKSQIAAALNTDMGLTTTVFPNLDDGSTTTSPEINDDELEELTRYISLIGVAARRNLEDPEAIKGEEVFNSIGCTDCHIPTMITGSYHPMAELRNQTIHAFTDLLLHDMGEGLADNMGEEQASGAEWRTAPLWNIGLTAGVSGGEAYLHDGRARNLAEAILWHGGEGETAKEAFRTSSASDREALVKYLKSL